MKISNSNYSILEVQCLNPKLNNYSKTAFRGLTGDKAVEVILKNNKQNISNKVTIVSLFTLITGVLGTLNKSKVSDVFEAIVSKFKEIQGDNERLTKELAKTKKQVAQYKQSARAEFEENERRLRDSFSATLEEKNNEIKQKDAKIAELSKYETMAKVKSIYELEIVSPDEFIELLKEGEELQPLAEKSILNFIFTGQGQEDFLEQIELNNKILKTKKEGITNISEIKKAYDNCSVQLGIDAGYIAQSMIKKVLLESEDSKLITYPPIRKQVLENINAIVTPLYTKEFHYDSNDKILDEVISFNKNLDDNKNLLIKDGWKFEGITLHPNKQKNYYTFSRNGEKLDIFKSDLGYGNFGYSRKTLATGVTTYMVEKGYWQ